MKDKFSISIVIPNWNGRHLLEQHLPFVIKAAQNSEILVVDDASTDDSVEFLKKKYPTVKIVVKEKNEGFSSSVNSGVSKAEGDIVILLNTDIEPEGDFLGHLISHFSDEGVFAVGCMDKSVEDGKVALRGRGEASWQRGLYIHKKGEVNKTDTAWVSGGSGAFRKKYWLTLGGMDELMNPFYWEDIDLSYRALKSGYRILFEPLSVVIHKHEEGVIKTAKKKNLITRTAYRNQLLFTWKNITDTSFFIEHLLFLPVHLISSLIHGDLNFFLGFIDAIWCIHRLVKKRKDAIQFFVKSDTQLLPRNFS